MSKRCGLRNLGQIFQTTHFLTSSAKSFKKGLFFLIKILSWSNFSHDRHPTVPRMPSQCPRSSQSHKQSKRANGCVRILPSTDPKNWARTSCCHCLKLRPLRRCGWSAVNQAFASLPQLRQRCEN